MSLFDQQPMGPVPAQHPKLLPPDPELEELVGDRGSAEVRMVEPLPPELAEWSMVGSRRWSARRWGRVALAIALLIPSALAIGVGMVALLTPDYSLVQSVRTPGLIVGSVLLVTILAGHFVLRYFARRAKRG